MIDATNANTIIETLSLPLCVVPVPDMLTDSLNKAIGGGVAGASAAAVQVLSLMWLRTAMNYQYRYGNGTIETIRLLYSQGGISRLYQGLPFALIQGPLSRFGDTASNILLLSTFEVLDPSGNVPVFIRTGVGSVSAGLWRILIMPVDTVKTCLQVFGSEGVNVIKKRLEDEGVATLYAGSIASAGATILGHYPWFLTFNLLSNSLPTALDLHTIANDVSNISDQPQGFGGLVIAVSYLDDRFISLMRSAFIGLCASSVSDICSNSMRVLKTSRQTVESLDGGSNSSESYISIAKSIIQNEGLVSFFTRGLQTRLLVNVLQGMLFSVLFKYFNGDKR